MPNEKQKRRPHEREVEVWARALGVSPQRLIALVEEIAKERTSSRRARQIRLGPRADIATTQQ